MAYTPYTWQNNNPSTPLSAANLNHIEQGIKNAAAVGDNALPGNINNPNNGVDFNNITSGVAMVEGVCPNSPQPDKGISGFLITITYGNSNSKVQLCILTWNGSTSHGMYYRTYSYDYDSPWSSWYALNESETALSALDLADLMVEAAASAPAVMADQPSTVTDDVKAYIDASIKEAIAQWAAKVKTLAADGGTDA